MDYLKEYIQIATELGVITKGGAWYTYGEQKYQGEENLYKMLLRAYKNIHTLEKTIASNLEIIQHKEEKRWKRIFSRMIVSKL